MKVATLFVKHTNTIGVAPPDSWRGPAFRALAIALFFSLIAAHTHAAEPAFSQAAEEAAAQLADAFPIVKGSVTGVEKDRVLIDLGAKQVYQGMELQVYREGDEVKHPVTGEVLGRRDKKLGLLRVVEVKEKFSETVIASREEGSSIRPKDLVRVSSDRLVVGLPLIDVGGVKEANADSVTKDLAIALAKTGHFIVIEEPLLKATLGAEHSSRVESFNNPSTLKLLAEKAHVQLLVQGKLNPGQQGLFMNLQVMSVVTGAPLTVASVEVTQRGPMVVAAPSRSTGQDPSAAARPAGSFRASDRPKETRLEGAATRKGLAAEEAVRKPGTPSFLTVSEPEPPRPDDKSLQESLVVELSDPLLALAVGDLDGDRRPEIVGITPSEVIVYRWQNQQLVSVARMGSPRSIHHLHLDVGSVNGRSRDQVVVTALSGSGARNELRSFVLELEGGQLVRIADKLGYFLRVVMGPGLATPILIGQRMGELDAFEGPIVRLTWDGGRYVEGQPLVLPVQVKNLYEFAPIKAAGDQILEIAVISEQRVKTYGSGGKPIWEGKDELGDADHLAFSYTPSHRAILDKYGLKTGGTINPEEYAAQQVLPRRLLVEAPPVWGNATAELLTFTNPKKVGAFRTEMTFPPSRVVTFDRQDGTFARGWQTIPLEGKVRDVALADLNGAGRKDLIVLSAVKEKGLIAQLQDASRGIISVFSFIR